MNQELYSPLAVVLLVAVTRVPIAIGGQPGRRPNILFILTDDQAPQTLKAYGNRVCHTPSLDRLATEGMTLTAAHHMGSWSGAVCTRNRSTGAIPTDSGTSGPYVIRIRDSQTAVFGEDNEWATLIHDYVPWNQIENEEADGIEKIKRWGDSRWSKMAERNQKVIPRVYLHWSGDRKYWPVELSLMEPRTGRLVWREPFHQVDIRAWLPGDHWQEERGESVYIQPALTYTSSGSFILNDSVAPGEYYLVIAILDPAGQVPSLRFAIENYRQGGHHPIGYVGVGQDAVTTDIDPRRFDDPGLDRSLYYVP